MRKTRPRRDAGQLPGHRGRLGMMAGVLACAALAGCGASGPSVKDRLTAGYAALQQHQYAEATAAADDVLKRAPNGPGAAEAYYLRGRVLEDRAIASTSPAESADDFKRAAVEYRNALASPISPDVEGLARSGLALGAFYQEDYPMAVQEWAAAYPKLTRGEDQSKALYRLGQCFQRLGRWDDADKYYAAVQQQFPGSDLAREAARHQGARAFTVRLATFRDARAAEAAAAQVRAQRLPASLHTDAGDASLQYVQVAPIPTYAEAKSIKARFAATYPNAIILP